VNIADLQACLVVDEGYEPLFHKQTELSSIKKTRRPPNREAKLSESLRTITKHIRPQKERLLIGNVEVVLPQHNGKVTIEVTVGAEVNVRVSKRQT